MGVMNIAMTGKGQITVYIILGLVLLVLVASVLYIRQTTISIPSKQLPAVVVDAPAEIQSLFAFVTSCVEQVGEDGLRLIGSQGGYAAPRFTTQPNSPTESEMVFFSPNSARKVPYWFFMKSPNDCTSCAFGSRQPLLMRASNAPSIQAELERYVDTSLDDCLNGFKNFALLNVTTQTLPSTKATITDKNVLLQVEYVISASAKGKSFTLDSFVGELSVRLKELYEIADAITELESQHQFLERATKNIITGFSRVSPDALPPFSATQLGIGSDVFWIKSDVQRKLKSILSAYIPLLQVWGSDSFSWRLPSQDVGDKTLFETFYNRDMLIPLKERHPGIQARLSYLDWWPAYIDLNCRGQWCGPQTFQNAFGFLFGMQTYAFAYDVSIPVLVELVQPSAFHGKNGGFSFSFMLELNLRNNNPVTVKAPLQSFSLPFQGSLLCDQRSSAPVTVTVKNRATQEPVRAGVSFSCGDETCAIGTTINGSMTSYLPVCFGGVLQVFHEDYAPAQVSLSTKTDEPAQAQLDLEPLREITIDVKRLLLKKQGIGWNLDPTPFAHGRTDQTVLVLTPLDHTGEPIVAELLGDLFSEKPSVRIIPGRYNVSLVTTSSDSLKILPHERCIEVAGEQSCVNVPEKSLIFDASKPLPVGGASFEWQVLPEQLDSATTATFFTVYSGIGLIPEAERIVEDISIGTSIADYSLKYRTYLTPVIT